MAASRDRDSFSDSVTASDAGSSVRKRSEDSARTPTPRGKQHTTRSQDVSQSTSALGSLSTPSSSRYPYSQEVKETRQSPNIGGLQRSQTYPQPSTPSKSSKERATPAGTPTSRGSAIENAFKKLNLGSNDVSAPPTPSRSQSTSQVSKPVVIYISSDEEDSEEEIPTDNEPIQQPTRPSSFYDDPSASSAPSSQSSINSLFSSISAISSISSVGLPEQTNDVFSSCNVDATKYLASIKRSRKTSASDTGVRDTFSSDESPISPNVTSRKRRPQKRDVDVPISTTAVAIPKRELKGSSVPIPPVLQQAAAPSKPSPTVPPEVVRFVNGSLCADLDEAFIGGQCVRTQKMLDDYRIEWGTQYELARGVSNGSWTWDEVRDHILELRGKNADAAYKVDRVMTRKSSLLKSGLAMWEELDREQAAILENKGRGLGLMGEWQGEPNWYGGRIQQLGHLVKEGTTYKVVLERMEKKRSHRFARYYGSRRFIQIGIPEDLLKKENAAVKNFVKRKFILCGRVFVPFHSKDKHIYLVETDENCGRSSQTWCGDLSRRPFNEFINWHNPLDQHKNFNQVISKWATRFALGLSNSVPVLEFEEENIFFINDIHASDWPKDKKGAPAEKVMTDGCGLINHAALVLIVRTIGLESLPAGIQGRIDGSKGFWILHPTDDSTVPKIWIRDSQNKIKNHSFDRAHRIFDLLGPSRPSHSIALSAQCIINLFSNNVPQDLLVHLMEQGLMDEIMPLLDWNNPSPLAMLFLANAISKCGNIPGARTQRLTASLSRALGLKGRDWKDEPVPEGSEKQDEPAAYTGRHPYSGAPLALHECAYELLQAGFHPSKSKILQEKIGYVVTTTINSTVEKYRIPIPESVCAFVVPDPLGVLEEGEIYYRFSKPRKDPKTEMLVHVLEGDVLVKAVAKRELDKWVDVIVVSTKGAQSLPSFLSGGDMDGDEPIIFYDLELVECFDSKPLAEAPPDFMENNFDRDVESVGNFCTRIANASPRSAGEAFLEVLVANLSESQKGLYDMMHGNAVVKYGYGHPETIRLAYIFSTLLDASKTGRHLKTGVFNKDMRQFGHLSRLGTSSSDILSILKAAGERKGEALQQQFLAQSGNGDAAPRGSGGTDKDLLKPYNVISAFSLHKVDGKVNDYWEELNRVRDHVKIAENIWLEACRNNQQSPVKGGKRSKKAEKEVMMLDASRKYAEPIDGIKLIPNVEEVKASYAYTVRRSFAFSVAFNELCHIKALASPGGHIPTLRMFAEAQGFNSSYMRAATHFEEE
ncbi:hypothetical protein NLJ89_g5408 [Agrocybe chaxingu]|uniref:RNA-dependent RNA polymerase n=1 Tax=Agrocybe chaxingu TaxID=84603 RepID=A0A9W8K0N7_9AGAR|nr:hypothetical protein NLJ89_g5408 [Agrocybe chaxingu]